jgi:nicotinate-nucleotide adenylyltransferase
MVFFMRQFGLFGGSFDPIHFGHINLALEILEKGNLEKILFCPANISPHKTSIPPRATSKERVEMVSLAIQGMEKFELFDEEIKRGGVSYTIETLQMVRKKFAKDVQINLIIDQGLIKNFHEWKEWQEITQLVNIIIGCRATFSKKEIPPSFEEISNKKFIITSQFEVSSTLIRDRLARGLYCGHLVPAKVLDYIYKHRLYLFI